MFWMIKFPLVTKLKICKKPRFEMKRNGCIHHSIFLEHKYDSDCIIEN